ncbi:MAG: hypothetical protein ACJ0DJ_01300 [bacterium]
MQPESMGNWCKWYGNGTEHALYSTTTKIRNPLLLLVAGEGF